MVNLEIKFTQNGLMCEILYNSSITRTASSHFHLLKNLEKEVKFSHICLTAISLFCIPSSCYQKGKIHLLNQHQPVKKCAAEKIIAVRKNTTLKMVLEIRGATQNFREFARNNMNTYFMSQFPPSPSK